MKVKLIVECVHASAMTADGRHIGNIEVQKDLKQIEVKGGDHLRAGDIIEMIDIDTVRAVIDYRDQRGFGIKDYSPTLEFEALVKALEEAVDE